MGNSWPPAGSKLVTKPNVSGETYLGPATATAGTSGLVYGSWVELTPSTAAEYYIVGVSVAYLGAGGSVAASRAVIVDIGLGAGGSEATLATVHALEIANVADYQSVRGPLVPIRVSSGRRITARATNLSGATPGIQVRVMIAVIPVASVEGN